MVGTMDTLIIPFVPIRGKTSSEIPQLKNASRANMNLSSPGIAAICMSRSMEFTPFEVVRLELMKTFGYFVVISTVAFLPDETMILGLEKMRASSVACKARSVSDISEKSSVPVKWVTEPLAPWAPAIWVTVDSVAEDSVC